MDKNTSVKNGDANEFGFYSTKDTRTSWQQFKDSIYNTENHDILGRPKKQWGISFLFYLSFYTVLAILCAVYMKVFLFTLDEIQPRWTLASSLIGENPGMGYRPMDENDQSAVITYAASSNDEVKIWKNRIDKFLAPYSNASLLPNEGRNQDVCDFSRPRKHGMACAVDVTRKKFGDCSYSSDYGYNHSSPCVFLKLNKIFGWIPEYYDDVENLPSEMPASLVKLIKNRSKSERQYVWVTCHGENPHDNEAIGPLEYFPKEQGLAGFYYPYDNVPEYLSPLVAVKFIRPLQGQLINVECRAWAKNIKYAVDKGNRMGSVHFELMVD